MKLEINFNQKSQGDFFQDMAPGWCAYIGGFGSGKTFIGARKFVLIHLQNESKGLLVAPTLNDIYRFMIPEISTVCAELGLTVQYKAPQSKESACIFIGSNPYPIYIIGGSSGEHISGFEIGHVWIDEGCRIKTHPIHQRDVFTNTKARLRGHSAVGKFGMITSTPEGIRKNCWVYQNWVANPISGYRIYFGKTKLNKYTDSGDGSYYEGLLKSYTHTQAQQYLDGKFVPLAEGRAHREFDKDLHIRTMPPPENNSNIYIGCDFNVDKMSWVIGYEVTKNYIHIYDEIQESDTRVDRCVDLIHQRGWLNTRVKIEPDRSCTNRSSSGDTIAQVMKKRLQYHKAKFTIDSNGANPRVIDRINKVNMMLKSADDVVHLTIDPKCTNLIDSLSNAAIKGEGYDKESGLDHPLDALGYLLWWYSPNPTSSTMNY